MLKIVVILFICLLSVARAIPRPTVDGQNSESVDICSLPATQGEISCSGIFYRWTYNTTSETCEKYVYGGCYGTDNLFRNQYACLAKCNTKGLEKLIAEGDSSSPCLQPKIVGTCRAVIPSFYFDSTKGLCTSFNYSGCDGNANNFASLEGCEKSCYGPNTFWDQPPPNTPTEEKPVAEAA